MKQHLCRALILQGLHLALWTTLFAAVFAGMYVTP
jgi:hypothetical protein